MTVLVIIHFTLCILLIALVLLQDPKGGTAGGMFGGGGSNSLLGATGATTFLAKVTRGAAVGFAITCVWLTVMSKPDSGSVIDNVPAQSAPAQQPQSAPAPAPAEGAAPQQAPAQQPPAAK